MAHSDEMVFSSPDPLALSNENILKPSALKVTPRKRRDPVISPRKPLTNSSGDTRVQEFMISTPPAKGKNHSPTKSPLDTTSTSPWRIRLTLQAEQVEERERGGSRNSSPTKRLAERTTTITVPLKGGDDTSPALANRGRGRGRPRNSVDSPKKRAGTPKPKVTGRRKTAPAAQEDETENSNLAIATPPKTARGRPKKSVEPDIDIPEFATDSLLLTSTAEKPESAATARNNPRKRSRGRRKEITPMKVAMDSDVETSLDSSNIIQEVQVLPKQPPERVTEKIPVTLVPHGQSYQPRLRHSSSPLLESSSHTQSGKQNDEGMWPSKVQSDSASPKASGEEPQGFGEDDPTNEHHEYDTILESEGFSMVSVESLASAGNPSNESIGQRSVASDGNQTPDSSPSPSEPPAHEQLNLLSLPRHVDRSREGTPKLARVVRAGIALQGVLSPHDGGGRLGSPFGRSSKGISPLSAKQRTTSSTLSPSNPKVISPKQRLDNLFSGFGAGTRRELRAGLRLGEELAKRQQNHARQMDPNPEADEDVFRAATNVEYPGLPECDAQSGYSLVLPASGQESGERITYPKLSRNQLPTPERSDADEDDDRMSWKADTPVKALVTTGTTASAHSKHNKETPDESAIDHSMMAREAEWQREREAISRQIEMANISQVIVIDSDEEDDERNQHQEPNPDDDDEEEGSDIWQAEAHSLERSRDLTPELSSIHLQPEAIKPRRSKLPSPWRRNSSIVYSDEPELPDETLSQQARDPVKANAETSLDDTMYSNQPDDSTGALIARQLSPIKEVNNTHDYVNEGETVNSTQHDESTGALIFRQLSPTKAMTPKATTPEASWPSTRIHSTTISAKSIAAHDDSEVQAETDSVPATPNNRYEEDHSETFDGDTTVTSIGGRSDDRSFDRPPAKPLGKIIGNKTALIDPHLLQAQDPTPKPTQKPKHAPRPPLSIEPASPGPTSWMSRLTTPIFSILTPSPSLPPPATKSDILCSSLHEPLCQLTPWEPCHTRALAPLYYSSLLYGAHIFPFNPKGPSAAYHGITVTTSLGWSRKVTKRDCSVADAFMVLLDERGYALAEPEEQWIEEGLAVRMCISIWVGMIMRGEVEVDEGRGEKVGLRNKGDRIWTKGDVRWEECESEYFERKKREFDGLPSWKEKGIRWPPASG